MEFQRARNKSGDVVYVALDHALRTWKFQNFGRGDWGITKQGEDHATVWAESREEAILTCEVLSRGGSIEHKTHCWGTRHEVPPRGSWKNIWSWRCSCGARSSGGYDRTSAHVSARDHRIGAMREFVDARPR